MKTLFLKAAVAFPVMLVLSLALAPASRGYAQTQADSSADRSLHGGAAAGDSSSRPTGAADAEIPPAVAKELQEMRESIEQLKAELRARKAQEQASPSLVTAEFKTQRAAEPAAPATVAATSASQTVPPEKPKPAEPFAYADWTWLNGTSRTTESPLDSKYFTGEFRADTNFTLDANHPRDDSLGGSTETFRSDEFQVEQLSLGGDLHVGNVRGRILTMFGMFSTTTPRNDA